MTSLSAKISLHCKHKPKSPFKGHKWLLFVFICIFHTQHPWAQCEPGTIILHCLTTKIKTLKIQGLAIQGFI